MRSRKTEQIVDKRKARMVISKPVRKDIRKGHFCR